ncbi:Gfo/Idh/MocA family oxidoreductase [Anaerobutyricum hallii]|uniref:Gfo/Idh/MocA family oxidoreductase n=1 Tax=Anaerobutyricum hallii TaxID=39488 RepID=UPI002671F861|nr:Gfo/Idh/MocA family oxidoreductase [Anaerobutyricum hallii]
MTKVITYGTYDLLHYGHIRLLERAKALGDYLIIGVTADDFDKARGKINVQQSLMERIEAVKATGLADEIIVEEYEGQKIDDIRKYDIDIFTVGSDWVGKFDYLKEYCNVVYLDRTEGISSSEIREEKRQIKLGLVGDASFLNKVYSEASFVNGIHITGLLTSNIERMNEQLRLNRVNSYEELLQKVDAVYIRSLPELHYQQIKDALENGKNVLCESPITLCQDDTKEIFMLAKKKNLIVMEAIKTAYATAFDRLLLLIKGGKIGKIISVDATCTSLKKNRTDWSGFYEWAPTALLPVFEILGKNYKKKIYRHKNEEGNDIFTKIDFQFEHAVASIKVGDGIKSEGELVISGTEGYIYVPAPWWKTDYFEIRYENEEDNKRYFYQLDGEGIRYELVTFVRAIGRGRCLTNISNETSNEISKIMEDCKKGKDTFLI